METRRSTGCPHMRASKWTEGDLKTLVPLIQNARKKSCPDCTNPDAQPVYICFTRDCGQLGCSRGSRGHALKHFKAEPTHSLALNCASLQVWCYECDDYISPPSVLKQAAQLLNDDSEDVQMQSPLQHLNAGSSVGLHNMGNSCFINSALQVLFNCPPLIGFFRNCSAFVPPNDAHILTHMFLQLVNVISTTDSSSISPAKFIKVAAGFNPAFHGYSQQDSMDFIRMLLDRFHEELKYSVPIEAFEEQSAKNRRKSGRLASKNNESIGSNLVHKSIISDTFSGFLRSEVQCHTCKKISVKDDQFFDLPLPINPSAAAKGVVSNLFSSIGESLGIAGKGIKLESTFVNFCLPEVLDGKDRYMCEHCKQLVQSTKTLSLKSLPQILCLQLKRFRHDTYFSSKVNTHVEFPLNGLDLRHFISKEFIGKYTGSSTEYDLLGIVNHRGSFNGGHYVAYCRNFETGNWLEFDDSRVRNVHEEDVMNVQAYLLFYMRRPDHGFNLQKVLSESSTLQSDLVYVSKQWYNRLLTCGNPGPIDSYDLICPHGNIHPLNGLCTLDGVLKGISSDLAKELVAHFGELGGVGIIEHPIECTVCMEEAEALRKRRRKEETEVMALDTSHIGDGECWHLIDSMWLQQWNDFKSGGPVPGPISNQRLFKNNGSKVPRDNLVRGEHYRGVNVRVWNYLYGIYGGGPVIKRRTINIYAE